MKTVTRIALQLILLSVMAEPAVAAIQVTRVTPNSGPTAGGTEVRIEGSGFFGSCIGRPCEETSVTFGGRPAQSFQVVSDSLVTATTPPVADVSFWYPVVSRIQVGNEEGGFTFYYTDEIRTPPLDTFARVLLPAYNCYLPGAHLSNWCTTLTVFNGSQDAAVIYPVYPHPSGISISALTLRPSRTTTLSLLRSIAGSFIETAPASARVIYIDRAHANDVHLNLRLFDLSRTSTTWGTAVPVIREQDLFTRTAQIFPVPMAARFRVALRVYDPFRNPDAAVAVRFFSAATDQLLASRNLDLRVLTRDINGTGDISYPGIAEIANLAAAIPELASVDGAVRIEIEPLTEGLRFWAMTSVTNDETQHVTLLTPAGPPAK